MQLAYGCVVVVQGMAEAAAGFEELLLRCPRQGVALMFKCEASNLYDLIADRRFEGVSSFVYEVEFGIYVPVRLSLHVSPLCGPCGVHVPDCRATLDHGVGELLTTAAISQNFASITITAGLEKADSETDSCGSDFGVGDELSQRFAPRGSDIAYSLWS